MKERDAIDDSWEPNEIDEEAQVVGGSLDGETLPVGDPSVTSLVKGALAHPVSGVKARVGEQEHYILSTSPRADGTMVYRWVLEELHVRGVR